MHPLVQYTTKELVKELKQREGVQTITVDPHAEYDINTPDTNVEETGPATILVVTD